MINGVRDEVGGDDVYRIVQMSEQNHEREKDGPGDECKAQSPVAPEKQCHHKRRPGVPREKKVVAEEVFFQREPKVCIGALWEGRDMRQ